MYSWSENICSRGIALTCVWYRANFGLCSSILYSSVQISLEVVGATLSVFETLGSALFEISSCTFNGIIVLQELPDQLLKCILIILCSPLLLMLSIGQALYMGPKTTPLFPLADKHFWIIHSAAAKVAAS